MQSPPRRPPAGLRRPLESPVFYLLRGLSRLGCFSLKRLPGLYKKMDKQSLILDLKEKLVQTLNLQDLEPGTLEACTPLFADEGLGLDSVDALELVVMVERDYGITVDGKDEAKTIFASLDALADYIIARK